jgi:hypothetical protein
VTLSTKQIRAVATGRVTQARIRCGERRLATRKDADRRGRSATYWIEPWTPVVGHEVTVHGYRIAITAKARRTAGDLTYEDAKAEGHGNIDNAKRAWVREHDAVWIDRHKVNLAAALGPGVVDAILLERFERRWTDEPAWIVGVAPTAARPLFMARVSGATSSRSMSIDPDAEMPGKEWLDKYAKDALGFCIGRQLERAREAKEQRARNEAIRRPMKRAA